jgi:predicted nucleic acid-binding protein
MGEVKAAEARFAALIEASPDWAWGYIGWSDQYWLFKNSPKDYDKAEAILQRALARPNLEDRSDVLDRLNDLRKEQAQARVAKRPQKRQRKKR